MTKVTGKRAETWKKNHELIKHVIKNSRGISVTQIADETRLRRPTVYNHLEKLSELGDIVKKGRFYFWRSYYEKEERARELAEAAYEMAIKDIDGVVMGRYLPFFQAVPQKVMDGRTVLSYTNTWKAIKRDFYKKRLEKHGKKDVAEEEAEQFIMSFADAINVKYNSLLKTKKGIQYSKIGVLRKKWGLNAKIFENAMQIIYLLFVKGLDWETPTKSDIAKITSDELKVEIGFSPIRWINELIYRKHLSELPIYEELQEEQIKRVKEEFETE